VPRDFDLSCNQGWIHIPVKEENEREIMRKQLCQLKRNGLSYLRSSAQKITAYSRYTTERSERGIKRLKQGLVMRRYAVAQDTSRPHLHSGISPHSFLLLRNDEIINANIKTNLSVFYQLIYVNSDADQTEGQASHQ